MKYTLFFLLSTIVGCQFLNTKDSFQPNTYATYFKPKIKKSIALIGVNVIPIKKNGILSNQIVLIEKNRIKRLMDNNNKNLRAISSKYQAIEAKGKYLMPGLIDAHVHIGFWGGIQDALLELDLFIANGVTSVRNMAGKPLTLELKNKVKKEKIIGPRIITTGPIYNGAQAYKGNNRADWCFRDSKPEKCAILSNEFARQRVIEDKKLGYDGIKSREYLSREAYLALYEESQKQGLDMVGHYPKEIDYKEFFKNKYQRSVDHLSHFGQFMRQKKFPFTEKKEDEVAYTALGLKYLFKDPKKEKEFLSYFSISGIYFVPTLSLKSKLIQGIEDGGYSKNKNVDFFSSCKFEILSKGNSFYKSMQKWQKFKGKNYVNLGHNATKNFVYNTWKAGVPLVVGSDANSGVVISGFSTHEELEALSQSGIPNQEVLKAATLTAAQLLKLKGVGFIESGAIADLVLLDENPLENISATKKIRGVFTAGRYYNYKEIQNSLEQIKKAYINQKCRTSVLAK